MFAPRARRFEFRHGALLMHGSKWRKLRSALVALRADDRRARPGAGKGHARPEAAAAARPSRPIPRRPPRSFSAAPGSRRRSTPNRSAFTRGAVSPAASSCRSTAPNWQVMRLSRNRNWGHPTLIAFLKRFAPKAARASGWPGLLIGDHVAAARRANADRPCVASDRSRRRHLADAHARSRTDPRRARGDVGDRHGARRPSRRAARRLDRRTSRRRSAPRRWIPRCSAFSSTPRSSGRYAARRQASAGCARCARCGATITISIFGCSARTARNCRDQDPTPVGDGCDSSLAWWFTDEVLHPKKSTKTWPPMTMAALPAACREVLRAQ